MCECLSNLSIDISRNVLAKFSSSRHVLSMIFIATYKRKKYNNKYLVKMRLIYQSGFLHKKVFNKRKTLNYEFLKLSLRI